MTMINRWSVAVAALMMTNLPAVAQDDGQEGRIDVAIDGSDTVFRVPVGIAAQLCGVGANDLAQKFMGSDSVACVITQAQADDKDLRRFDRDDDENADDDDDVGDDDGGDRSQGGNDHNDQDADGAGDDDGGNGNSGRGNEDGGNSGEG